MAEDRHLHILSNDDVTQLIESRISSGLVSMLHPIDMMLSRDLLLQEVARTLQEVRALRQGRTPSADEARVAAVAEQQCIDFSAWLHTQPESVLISLYPSAEDGFDVDDCVVTQEELNDMFGEE